MAAIVNFEQLLPDAELCSAPTLNLHKLHKLGFLTMADIIWELKMMANSLLHFAK